MCCFNLYWWFIIILNIFQRWHRPTSLLYRGTHSIAVYYLHFAPEENPEYLSHFGKWNNFCSKMDKNPKQTFYLLILMFYKQNTISIMSLSALIQSFYNKKPSCHPLCLELTLWLPCPASSWNTPCKPFHWEWITLTGFDLNWEAVMRYAHQLGKCDELSQTWPVTFLLLDVWSSIFSLIHMVLSEFK